MPFAKSEIKDFDNWVFGLKFFFDRDPSTVYEITNFSFKKKSCRFTFGLSYPLCTGTFNLGFPPFCRCLIWIFISLFFLDFDFLPFRIIYHGLTMDFVWEFFQFKYRRIFFPNLSILYQYFWTNLTNVKDVKNNFSKRGIKIIFIHKANKKYSKTLF